MNVDGSNQTRLTNGSGSNSRPDWSPDSSKIAFSSAPDENSMSRSIYVMNADGSGKTRLTNTEYSNEPTWSPDGSKIAFTSFIFSKPNDAPSIYVMNADGSGITRLTENLASLGSDSVPDWSP
jgi:Tol biopolymer transport system component